MEHDDFATELEQGFNHLSIGDLLAAREQYHVFLSKHPNVVGTAIGRYLIRKPEVYRPGSAGPKPPRTLGNSGIDLARSWPCVLVFVERWESQEELLATGSPAALVPRTLYLPDGRAVPVCLVEAPRKQDLSEPVGAQIRYPRSLVAGGFPLLVRSQGREHMATVGCLVSDGGKLYALTNRHVCGEPGREVFSLLGGTPVRVGSSAGPGLQLAKVPFADVYPGWPGAHLMINADIGLVEIADANQWRTDVFGVGQLNPLLDVNVDNLTLAIIGQRVQGFGAGSGPVAGQVSALFYRYRSVGGLEYVADYLIGPLREGEKVVRPGDSGTVLLLETRAGPRPFALNWGAQEFVSGDSKQSHGFALATGLANVCRLLDVDIVRGWNIDQPYTWGKTGHFKIGFHAADLVADKTLAKFLAANQAALGYADAALLQQDVVSGKYTHDFVPLADVADIIWRTTRPSDESNHFCDIDETDPAVFDGKSLLQISLESDLNIHPDTWLRFDQEMDAKLPVYRNGVLRPREGALPFRVWQMYEQMIRSLQAGKVEEYLVAGGTMAHYVGDACQPLHISWLHHGANASESAVHSDYETNLIDRKMTELFAGVAAIKAKVKAGELVGASGREAAKLVLGLMKATVDRLPPQEILEVWRSAKGTGKYDTMWGALGERTIANIAAGSHAMAVLWQSAWKNGEGGKVPGAKLTKIPLPTLQALYNARGFVPSFRLSDIQNYKAALGL